ncbi:tryptophan synthase subunit alpha [Humisphaera borealis]|uniref:Tryptophan synthase alpha chain n=1 Tax=Humisphaera borealis TaxID=2807512 RepID=A0A7M2WY42_9BACT|nr:tryptophan synthase subunit alpha [Humisphaera borealis]QOV90418.1 tryptophan synthase subunit alpha [Humisphaera borealis]
MPAATAGSTTQRLSIARAFEAVRAGPHAGLGGGLGLVPFVPAGFPSLETTAELLPRLETVGATLIEVGFPFSDPVADGPVIQEAFTYALSRGVKVADVFAVVKSVRDRVSIPIVGMLSYSIVFRIGVEAFVARAKESGFDGLIIPDLPPPEAQKICKIIHAGGLDTSLLVAPTTAEHRRSEIARLSTGFVYYLSVSGITGERDQLPADLAASVRSLKALTDKPVCVGFGISKPSHVAMLRGVADGAIIGSAIVRRMQKHVTESPKAIADAVCAYLSELRV